MKKDLIFAPIMLVVASLVVLFIVKLVSKKESK